MAWREVWGVVPALTAVVPTALVLSRGTRQRGRISRDLEIIEKLPDGEAKTSLIGHVEDGVRRLVAREQGSLDDIKESSVFVGMIATLLTVLVNTVLIGTWDGMPSWILLVAPPVAGLLGGWLTWVTLRLRAKPV